MRKRVAFTLIVLLVFLGGLEGALRLCGWGGGKYRILYSAANLYEPHLDMVVDFGAIPYRLQTNALGMRSPEMTLAKRVGSVRIVAIGDSHTDGFFVDNEATYPWQLEQLLTERGRDVQVLNVAAGGGSIDKEFANLRSVENYKPDIVLLQFCTNDPGDLSPQVRERFAGGEGGKVWGTKLQYAPQGRASALTRFLFVNTAVGECALDLYIRSRSRPEVRGQEQLTDRRYDIAGARQFDANAYRFLQLCETWGQEAATMRTSFSPRYTKLVDTYFDWLAQVKAWCDQRDIVLVLLYMPEYSQVYLPNSPMPMRDQLAAWCKGNATPFCDLTPSFQAVGRKEVLYLAPLDWHMNPSGYRVMAAAVADYLEASALVAAPTAKP